ncbi:hypothetical protein Sjap_016198 [Stephania japonica]|uniref:Uncharacterized protein n=1 Tax=Stephania japonica TaxID=461633 RepID=A0AAP0NUS1_9MAGN
MTSSLSPSFSPPNSTVKLPNISNFPPFSLHPPPTRNRESPRRQQRRRHPNDDVKTLAEFQSKHNYIRVVEVSRRADHPFAGSRLLLLDKPGNIHSISNPLNPNPLPTNAYFDVLATLPPLLPPGPIAILGCVEAESGRDGGVAMEEALRAVSVAFGGEEVSVLTLGVHDCTLALTGEFPDLGNWREMLPSELRGYAHMWIPYNPGVRLR